MTASSHEPVSGTTNPSMMVIDSSGDEWMVKWKTLFNKLDISHLRSPMFFHPDPRDRDGLLAFAHANGREEDCLEIAGCVGKEISKHQMKKKMKKRCKSSGEKAKPSITIDERDRKDYFAPPSDVFGQYCRCIAERYDLRDPELIRKATLTSIDYDYVPQLSAVEKLFILSTDKAKFYARAVVLSVGAGNTPSIPKPFPQNSCPCACHAFQPADGVLTARVKAKQPTNVIVVGGGLTSAQIADQVIRKGATKVFLFMRGPLKIKPFDVDLSWMGKFRNHEKASFWSADTDEERSELVKSARGGGSIPPRFVKILDQHVKAGRLSIHTHTTIRHAKFNPLAQTWSIQPEPSVVDLPEDIHFVYFATGVQSDVETLPYLQTLREKYPVETFDGLPALTDDLMWEPNVPLFMTGKLAALRLGPGAGNLEGARLGAERIVWAFQHLFGKGDRAGDGEADGERYVSGIGSRFEALHVE